MTGTLRDDVDLAIDVVNTLLDEYALATLSVERYRDIFDFPVRRYYERAGFDLSLVDFATLSRRFTDVFERRLQQARLFDATYRVLETFAGHG